ncbi:hypothetical protein T06_15112 [Trichinella sp. T6]|nr:hypothetical protein T06_15112 [Trichinella sp. T6]
MQGSRMDRFERDASDPLEEATPLPALYKEEAIVSFTDSSASGEFPVYNCGRSSLYQNQARCCGRH